MGIQRGVVPGFGRRGDPRLSPTCTRGFGSGGGGVGTVGVNVDETRQGRRHCPQTPRGRTEVRWVRLGFGITGVRPPISLWTRDDSSVARARGEPRWSARTRADRSGSRGSRTRGVRCTRATVARPLCPETSLREGPRPCGTSHVSPRYRNRPGTACLTQALPQDSLGPPQPTRAPRLP